MIQTGVLFGLSAALLWGVADFCARGASRAGGTFRTLLFVQIIAIPALLLVAAPLGLIALRPDQWPAILAAAAVGVLILGGAGLTYRAFAIGKLALMSPIVSGFAAVTALLAITTGERLAGATLLGVIVTLAGVILASSSGETTEMATSGEMKAAAPTSSRRKIEPGLLEALGATVLLGIGFWLLGFIVPMLGGVTTQFVAKVTDLVVLGSVALFLRTRATRTSRIVAPLSSAFWLWVLPTALLDTAASIAYNIGVATALTAIVVALASLYSPVTVLLAWLVLHERLAARQWAGVIVVLAGVGLINLPA